MFDTFFGLPTHAIVVHAVVVFVPVTAMAAVALTGVRRWRTRFGVLAGLAALVSMVSVFVAQESGQVLEDRVLRSPDAPFDLVRVHTQLGEDLLPWVLIMAIALLAVVALSFWAQRSATARALPWVGPAGWLLGAISVAGAVLSIVYVIRIGHSGSAAVWSDLPS